jgi:transposase
MVMSKEQEVESTVPERWSARAKSEVVLRLFRGESVDAVSREIQVPVHEVETWRKEFLEGGAVRLKKRGGDPDERALRQTQAKVGELTMKLELAEMLLEKRGYGDELVRLKKSRGW